MSDDFFDIVGTAEKPKIYVCKRYIPEKEAGGYSKSESTCGLVATSEGSPDLIACPRCGSWLLICDCKPPSGRFCRPGCPHLSRE